jgi:hypothetical protein
MVSELVPHINGAEVPIAGAHVPLQAQGPGLIDKPREDARMTMSRLSFCPVVGEQEDPLAFLASTEHCCAAHVTFQVAMSCERPEVMYAPTRCHSFTRQLEISVAKRSLNSGNSLY